jgi:predicted DNA-binding transcriptional regulator AlpA
MEIIRFSLLKKKFGGISRSTVDRWEKEKNFPKRISLGPNTVGWDLEAVDNWLKDKSKNPPQ